MKGGSCSKLGSRLSAPHIRLRSFQQLQGWRAVPFQNWALALAPRTFVFKFSNRYRDGGRLVFKIGLSPEHRAHSSYIQLHCAHIRHRAWGGCAGRAQRCAGVALYGFRVASDGAGRVIPGFQLLCVRAARRDQEALKERGQFPHASRHFDFAGVGGCSLGSADVC